MVKGVNKFVVNLPVKQTLGFSSIRMYKLSPFMTDVAGTTVKGPS